MYFCDIFNKVTLRHSKANGIKFSVGEREALECGVKAKALLRLPPLCAV